MLLFRDGNNHKVLSVWSSFGFCEIFMYGKF